MLLSSQILFTSLNCFKLSIVTISAPYLIASRISVYPLFTPEYIILNPGIYTFCIFAILQDYKLQHDLYF